MGLILPKVKISSAPLILSALVVNTMDAERLLIIDRATGNKVAHFIARDGDNVRVLPQRFSVEPSLAVIMFDDDGQYNAAVSDNVQSMIIDLITFDFANPQPYEP